ncbi:MAG TPA: EAL domain-containing protein [Thermodesulfobacteriota bacterium]|nr:EAL domain-containing protein [Thermodesulfobacteriota bacterium]
MLEEELQDSGLYDTLTGLPNQTLFMEYLGRVFERAKQQKDYLFALLYLDLDHFSVINDRLGDMIGDQLLIEVSKRVESCLRSDDKVARLEGDEFAVLLGHVKDVSDAAHIAERIQKALEFSLNINGEEHLMSAGIGIALNEKDNDSSQVLLHNAETAMKRAKTLGTSRYVIFDIDRHKFATRSSKTETALWRAIDRQEFRTYYHPILSLETGEIIGCEALVRWQHPELGFIPPWKFVPLAEETGLIASIDEWVLRTACAQIKAWHDLGHSQQRVAVNFSARQFQQQNFPTLIRKVLDENGLSPRALELEITERTAVKNINSTQRTLHELRSMGIRISIDDFGTGYSSMSYLKSFPIDTLKIDRSFVRDIKNGLNGMMLIKTIIAMAHGLKLEVIAEGVETEEQLAFLSSQHCDEMQGFLFSQPVPAEEFTRLLQKGKRLSSAALDKAREKWVRKRLGELLVEAGFIDREQLRRALNEKKSSNEKLGQILMSLGYITEDILIDSLSKQCGTPGMNLYKTEIDERAFYMVPRDVAEKYKVIPVGFKVEGRVKRLIVAMANPSNLEAIDVLTFITGHTIEPVFSREEQFKWIIQYYHSTKAVRQRA